MATNGADKKAGQGYVQALSPFKYDDKSGLLVRGQVFKLVGHPNDDLLLGQDFVRPVKARTPLVECSECGGLFLDDHARERHGRHFHDQWCDCGWKPAPHQSYDRDKAMAEHMRTCPVWKGERDVAAKRHLEVALASG